MPIAFPVNGCAGVQAATERRFDLILMDCQMAEMDGFEATAMIRRAESDGAARVPIIALTANAMAGDRDRCLAAGMDDYLSKPFTGSALHAICARWLGRAAVPASTPASLLAPAASVIDERILASIRVIGGDDLLERVIKLFAQNSIALVQALHDAIASTDVVAIASAAHALKSVSLNLGAVELSDICNHIERNAGVGIIVNEQAARLDAACERARIVLGSRYKETRS